MKINPRIGIALSGGGARGIAHIGVLKALEENNITIARVAGTSMGAIVGVLYAAGYSSKEITQMLKDEKIYKWFKVEWFSAGFLSLGGVKDILSKYIESNDFDHLKLPFSVGVSNISKGRGEIVNKGNNLLDFVVASASIPIVFSPVNINDNSYVDGGLFHNLPAEALVGQCEYIIGSNVNPITKEGVVESVKHVGERVFNLSIAQNVWQSRTYCDFYIEPKDLREFSAWDYNKIDEIIEIGYKTAIKSISKFILPELKEE